MIIIMDFKLNSFMALRSMKTKLHYIELKTLVYCFSMIDKRATESFRRQKQLIKESPFASVNIVTILFGAAPVSILSHDVCI